MSAIPPDDLSDRETFTIEELAYRSGQTTRNIRAYQSKGLIPPPDLSRNNRVGSYDRDHLARLRLIGRLQTRGFSLAGIADLLKAWEAGHSLDQVLGVESALEESRNEDFRLVTETELRNLLATAGNAKPIIDLMRDLGLLVREGSHYRLNHPNVLELGLDAVAAGIPPKLLLAEFRQMRRDAQAIAHRFVGLYHQHVWKPYLQAGMPADQLPEVVGRMKKLRSLASSIAEPLLADALADEIETIARDNLPLPETDAGLESLRPNAKQKPKRT